MLFHALPGFFGAEVSRKLLDHVLALESAFEPSTIGSSGTGLVDEAIRVSRVLGDLGNLRPAIEQRIRSAIPEILPRLGLASFEPDELQMELAAHGNGAFYKPHLDIDMATMGPRYRQADRKLSVVYYFFREPRSFSGGELRIHLPLGVKGDPKRYVDVAPQQDTAVAFSSWTPHEVRPIQCPSGRFADSRFALNCFVLHSRAKLEAS